MKNKLLRVSKFLVIALSISILNTTNVFAQTTNDDLEMLVSDTKNDLMIVVGGGLAGAVLGLSTLSFVEEPKDHTRNIIVGASIGIIFGVGYVAFSQATKTQDLLNGDPEELPPGASIRHKDFSTYGRLAWHQEEHSQNNSTILAPMQLNYGFKF